MGDPQVIRGMLVKGTVESQAPYSTLSLPSDEVRSSALPYGPAMMRCLCTHRDKES